MGLALSGGNVNNVDSSILKQAIAPDTPYLSTKGRRSTITHLGNTAQLAMLMPLARAAYCADLLQASYLFSLIALYAFIVSVIAFSTGNRSMLDAP